VTVDSEQRSPSNERFPIALTRFYFVGWQLPVWPVRKFTPAPLVVVTRNSENLKLLELICFCLYRRNPNNDWFPRPRSRVDSLPLDFAWFKIQ
jgi:hypothetical protein